MKFWGSDQRMLSRERGSSGLFWAQLYWSVSWKCIMAAQLVLFCVKQWWFNCINDIVIRRKTFKLNIAIKEFGAEQAAGWFGCRSFLTLVHTDCWHICCTGNDMQQASRVFALKTFSKTTNKQQKDRCRNARHKHYAMYVWTFVVYRLFKQKWSVKFISWSFHLSDNDYTWLFFNQESADEQGKCTGSGYKAQLSLRFGAKFRFLNEFNWQIDKLLENRFMI